MACHAELAYNQSTLIMELYTSPLAGLEEYIQSSILRLEELEKKFDEPIDTIVNFLNETEKYLEKIKEDVKEYQEV